MRNVPTTTQHIYISHIKHLTRTLNTYSKYPVVKKIWISFDKSCGKYHLTLNDDPKIYGIKYELVYVQELKNEKLKSITEITKVINSKISQRKQRLEVLVDFLNLVRTFNYIDDDGKIYNRFFFQDEEEIFDQIAQILPELKKDYEYDHKENSKFVKRRKVNTNIEKKFFNLFYHQLIYQNLDKVKLLEEDRNTEKQNVEDLVYKEISLFKELTEHLQQPVYSTDPFLSSQKELLLSALDNYGMKNNDSSQYNSRSYRKEDLEAELEVLEGLIAKEDRDEELAKAKINTENYIRLANKRIKANNQVIEIQLKEYLKEYMELVDYIITNEKNFTKNSITRYFVSFIVSNHKARHKSKDKLRTGPLRKKKLKEAQDRFDLIKDLEANEKHYFQLKVLEINKYIKENWENNSFLSQYYHIELDITDKDWKDSFKSKKEYIQQMLYDEKVALAKQEIDELEEKERKESDQIAEINKQNKNYDKLTITSENEIIKWLEERLKEEYEDFKPPVTPKDYDDYLKFVEKKSELSTDKAISRDTRLENIKTAEHYRNILKTIDDFDRLEIMSIILVKTYG